MNTTTKTEINGVTDPAAQVRDAAANVETLLLLLAHPGTEPRAREAGIARAREWLADFCAVNGVKSPALKVQS